MKKSTFALLGLLLISVPLLGIGTVSAYDPYSSYTVVEIDYATYLDIDGDGEVQGGTDGLLLIRYLFELRGNSLINGVYDAENCTRCDSISIENYLKSIKE